MQGFRELIELHLAHQAEREASLSQDRLRARIAELESGVTTARTALDAAEAQVKALQGQRRAAELDVEKIEQTRVKYRAQLMSAKTNDVYKTLLHEIETTGQAISERETVVIEAMELTDDANAAVEAARRQLAEAQRVRAAEEKTLEADIASLDEERKAAHVKAEPLALKVPHAMLSQYLRVAEARDGRGMALAKDHECSACHLAVRPQAWVELVTVQTPYVCAGCKRFLYREENLGVQTAQHSAGPSPDVASHEGRSGHG